MPLPPPNACLSLDHCCRDGGRRRGSLKHIYVTPASRFWSIFVSHLVARSCGVFLFCSFLAVLLRPTAHRVCSMPLWRDRAGRIIIMHADRRLSIARKRPIYYYELKTQGRSRKSRSSDITTKYGVVWSKMGVLGQWAPKAEEGNMMTQHGEGKWGENLVKVEDDIKFANL